MKKVISYSLFGADPQKEDGWEFLFYMRGFYFNVLMKKLVYPDWMIKVYVDKITSDKYFNFFKELTYSYGIVVITNTPDTLCKSMLWRMKPIFDKGTEVVICRDADALLSYREANIVNEFVESEYLVHGIHDNHAHTVPLMGGMCGFKAAEIAAHYNGYDHMLSNYSGKIDKRGSDQDFLTKEIYYRWKEKMMLHNFLGTDSECAKLVTSEDMKYRIFKEIPGVDKRLWVSNLCSFFIGSAGCNEMETLRFFRDHLPGFESYDRLLWKIYPKIFYWL